MKQHQNDGIIWFQFNIFKNYDGLITRGLLLSWASCKKGNCKESPVPPN
jgi:hypothetical protein